MVAVPKERSFPRGGRADKSDGPKKKVPDWCKNSSKAFDKKTYGRNRNKPFGKKTNAETVPEEMEAKDKKSKGIHIRPYTGKLKYNAIAEGMLIFGTIYRIRPYELGISLPGNCIGQVPITNISECYTRGLASLVTKTNNSDVHHLRDMFHIGQYVVTKVVKKEVLDSSNHQKIVLSLAPEVIHSDCSSEDVLDGTVFTAAVVSIQEKGYVMDLGIKSVRAFLMKENSHQFEKFWNKGKELGIGQLVQCLVTNVTTADLVTTIVLTSDPELVVKASTNKTGSRLQGMLPGMLFNVTVTRYVFPSGIQVRLSDNVIGYVPPNHLSKTFKKPLDYDSGRVHLARIIYISPSGAIFFSMKKNICPARPPVSPFKVLKAGFSTDSAVVWDVSAEGLTVRIGKSNDGSLKGVIPVKHINRKQAQETESESTLSEQLLNEFPIETKITCRVMDYCYTDQVYICTMDKDLMKEKYLHPSTLKVGSLVSCIVKEISPKGVVVALGKKSPVTGFVPISHVSNMPLLHPEKKFNVGQTCAAKVLSLDNHVQLTMKQPLIDSNRNLTNFDMAVIGQKYPGTIVLISQFGILVEFYCSFTAFIKRKSLGPHLTHKAADITETFFVGQVVNCTVMAKEKESRKLILSLVNNEKTSQGDDKEAQEANNEVDTDHANGTKQEKKKKTKKSKQNGSVTSDQFKLEGDLGDTETSFQEQGGLKRKKKQSRDLIDFQVPESEIKLSLSSKKLKLSRKSNETGNDLDKTSQRDHKEAQEANDEVETDNADGTKQEKKKKTKKSKPNDSVTSDQIKLDGDLGDTETGFQEQGGLKTKKKQSRDLIDFQVPESEIKLSLSSKKLKLSRKSNETGEDLDKAKRKRKLSAASMDFEVVSDSEINLAKSPNKSKKRGKLSTGSMDFEVVSDSEINPAKSPNKSKNKGKLSTGPRDFNVTKSEVTPAKSPKKSRISTSPTFEVKKEMNSSCEIKTSSSSKKAKKMKSSFKSKDGDSVTSITNGTGKKKKMKTDQGTPLTSKQKEMKPEDEPMDSDSSEGEEPSGKPVELPSLSVATGFVWDATPSLLPAVAGASCEEDSSDDEFVETKKVKRSRQAIVAEKRLQAQIEEARLRSIEQRLMDPEQLPQTADEFDRLVLSSPDNSMVWLQYMAHHIQATEIEKARSIAQRALKTISFREEQEKLNVWVAWLNLENLYGTTESMKNTFEEAIRLNDPYQVYMQTLQIYADTHKLQDGDELIAVITRKFKTIKDMWTNVATFYMKSGQTVKARALLQRALASLQQKEHVSVITQFALLENKLGTKERAQTLMEQILTSYPKRVDVWSVYVDMLIKSDLFDMARQVLERAVVQRLPSHKMKTLFKKFLAFEESHGSEEGANRVRQLALDYVEAAAGTTMQ